MLEPSEPPHLEKQLTSTYGGRSGARTHDLRLVSIPESASYVVRLAFFVAMANVTSPDDQ
jgi:hypothetical protein